MLRTLAAIAIGCVSANAWAQTPLDAAKGNLTIVVGPGDALQLRQDVTLPDLAARVRTLLPDPAPAHILLTVRGRVDLARMNAVDAALRDAGIASVGLVAPLTRHVEPVPAINAVPTDKPIPNPIAVSIAPAGQIAIDGAPVTAGQLSTRLIAASGGDRRTRVLVHGAPTTSYGDMIAAMQAILAAGFQQVAIAPDVSAPRPPAGP